MYLESVSQCPGQVEVVVALRHCLFRIEGDDGSKLDLPHEGFVSLYQGLISEQEDWMCSCRRQASLQLRHYDAMRQRPSRIILPRVVIRKVGELGSRQLSFDGEH